MTRTIDIIRFTLFSILSLSAKVISGQTVYRADDVSISDFETTDYAEYLTGEYYSKKADTFYDFTIDSGRGWYKIVSAADHANVTTLLGFLDQFANELVSETPFMIASTDIKDDMFVYVMDDVDQNLKKIFRINIIKFDMTINQCESDIFKFELTSTIKGENPQYGRVEILNTDGDVNCFTTALQGPIVFLKSTCGIRFELPSLVLYSNDPVFLSNDVSQLFNVTCRQDLTHVDVEHQVTEVTIEVDEIQNVFDSAYLIDMTIKDPASGNKLISASISQLVKLEVSLATIFRNDFNIRIDSCAVNSTTIYTAESGPTTSFFNDFVEESDDVFSSTFRLFRPSTNTVSSRLVFDCVVTTCLGDCPTPSSSRRKKRSLRSLIDTFTPIVIPKDVNHRKYFVIEDGA